MLYMSRGKKASLAKLNLLNDAVRSASSREKLEGMLLGTTPLISWRMRLEPAFGRNIDLLVGTGHVQWLTSSGRATLELSASGKELCEALLNGEGYLVEEIEFLRANSSKVTEAFVDQVLHSVRAPR